ncbi:MAG: hypothetical protein ABI893_14175 [Polaromonas sp.]|uniref:hypothetical protein n=1 Tax=Polaromonas sp. TaxID=1869339 RepID=UPI00326783D5
MNRCSFRFTPLLLALAASAGLLGLPALAQTDSTEVVKPNVRKFPAKAVRGEMVVVAPPVISMNGKQDRLSVGSRIRDINNHFALSGALLNQKLVVNYTRDNLGQVHEVWILNQEEAKEKRPGGTETIFNFNTGTSAKPADDGKTPYDQLPAYKQ